VDSSHEGMKADIPCKRQNSAARARSAGHFRTVGRVRYWQTAALLGVHGHWPAWILLGIARPRTHTLFLGDGECQRAICRIVPSDLTVWWARHTF
jgi:hypothetical protein